MVLGPRFGGAHFWGTRLYWVGAFRTDASCLDLIRTLDPGECHLVEEGFVGVVTNDPRQTQAFDGSLLILGYRHAPPPQYTDHQRLIGGNMVLAKLGPARNGRPHGCPAHPRHCRGHRPSDKVLVPLFWGTPHNRKVPLFWGTPPNLRAPLRRGSFFGRGVPGSRRGGGTNSPYGIRS
jgi:hypothetical protein